MDTVPNKARIGRIILSALLGLAMAGSGIMKLMDAQAFLDAGPDLGVPVWLIPIIGIIELGGAIALQVPRTRFWAALTLGGTMLGAVITHLIAADVAGIVPAAILGLIAAAIAWLARPVWVQERLRGAPA
jgi:uncharacterized membrane protein YphA (DoxX/SURF4 family)